MRKAAILAGLVAVLSALALPSVAAAAPKFEVLVFSKTAGFRHDSIETGVDRIRQLGAANNFKVDATEEASAFRANNLRKYDAVIFLSTTGNVLNENQQGAFENFIQDAAASSASTPRPTPSTTGASTATSSGRTSRATRRSRRRPWRSPTAATRPPSTCRSAGCAPTSGTTTAPTRAVTSTCSPRSTRAATTARGWTRGAITRSPGARPSAAGARGTRAAATRRRRSASPPSRSTCSAASAGRPATRAATAGRPWRAAIRRSRSTTSRSSRWASPRCPVAGGRVLMTERKGRVMLHDPETGLNTVAARLDVYQHDEEGVQSIAVDPKFDKNKWVYIYFSLPDGDTPVDDPSTPDVNEGDAPFEGTQEDWDRFKGTVRLSRFKMKGDEIDLDTEQRILDVPVDRGICCHVGGHIDFDGQGNLYLSTGDDTNPFESDGYAPIDEREERNPAFDAQRTSANTNDLRGKVLRIKPKNGGGYTIPAGNLFPKGAPQTKPEIYLMGLRNAFRIAVNRENGDVYVGDYSPDANEADPERGPDGKGKWFVARGPGNYGWPYCATDELPYQDWDFETETSRGAFDCEDPVNESPHNTGLRVLPAVQHPDVWYGYGLSDEFPELGTGGIGPMGGPAYDYDKKSSSRIKWPQYYDGVPLFYEWTRDSIQEMRLDGSGGLLKINPVLPSFTFDNPMDIEFGEDGALYTLEYGTGFFVTLPEAQLARVDHVRGNRTPVPEVSADPTDSPTAPLEVQFSSDGTHDPDGDRLTYEWDFDADGEFDSTEQDPTHTYEENGIYNATLKVTDRTGRSASAEVQIVVGEVRPVVEFIQPTPDTPFSFGDTVQFEIEVTDDDPVDCSRVQVSYILGHDSHGHPITSTTGCSGQITTSAPGHGGEENLRGVFAATYADLGPNGDGEGALEGNAEVVLTPGG